MEIYLLRHGIAEERSPSGSDAARRLTAEGREKLRRVLERARGANVRPSLVLTSPLVRAVETAELAAEILSYRGALLKSNALAPDASPQDLWSEVRGHSGEDAVLLAGHEPLFSASTAYLLACPALRFEFRKGALVRIDVERVSGEPRGVLQWVLTPKLAW
jgi:phosphohistidine phosphatase